jgi:hypothetical protein
LNFIDSSINVINFNELSFIHMVICIHVISMLFTCSCFFLYQYSKMYVVTSNHVNKFHSYVPISSKSFTITYIVNFIQGMRLKHMVQFHPRQNSSKSNKFNHMAQFHSCDQVHPNVASMESKFSWISSVSLNFYFMPNTVLTLMPCMRENPISCQIYPISII